MGLARSIFVPMNLAFSMLLLVLLENVPSTAASPLGVCWGRVSHLPIPTQPIVQMIKDSAISRVKLFDADASVLSALAQIPVEVMVMVKNQDLQGIAVDDAAAEGWVYANLQTTLPLGVNIKYVSVGNEPYLGTAKPSDDYLMLAVNRLQRALERAGLDSQIKLTVSFNLEILSSSYPASSGVFVKKWGDQIKNITALIARTGSVFSVNIYPYFTLKDNPKLDVNFVLFNNNPNYPQATPGTDPGNQLVYTNILDQSYDAVLAALDKIGFGTLDVIIGEVGWPTDGHPKASVSLSQQFNQGAVHHLMSEKGTPRRPNVAIPFYLFALLDEDAKSIAPGVFERRWGLYDALGVPKYPLDLSGASASVSSSVELPSIPGLSSLPQRWCVVSPAVAAQVSANSPDAIAELQTLVADVCGAGGGMADYSDQADCTPLTSSLSSPGLRCAAASASSPPSLAFNASYVLNAYYQVMGQSYNACIHSGLGTITHTDPSQQSCSFSVALDLASIDAYYQPSAQWSWTVFGYLVGLIAVLTTFL